jgi:hypothetical protein
MLLAMTHRKNLSRTGKRSSYYSTVYCNMSFFFRTHTFMMFAVSALVFLFCLFGLGFYDIWDF